jgi:hypothetical protein
VSSRFRETDAFKYLLEKVAFFRPLANNIHPASYLKMYQKNVKNFLKRI